MRAWLHLSEVVPGVFVLLLWHHNHGLCDVSMVNDVVTDAS